MWSAMPQTHFNSLHIVSSSQLRGVCYATSRIITLPSALTPLGPPSADLGLITLFTFSNLGYLNNFMCGKCNKRGCLCYRYFVRCKAGTFYARVFILPMCSFKYSTTDSCLNLAASDVGENPHLSVFFRSSLQVSTRNLTQCCGNVKCENKKFIN